MKHLEELRKRLVSSAIAVGACFVVCYIFAERLFAILVSPLKAQMVEGGQTYLYKSARNVFDLPQNRLYSGYTPGIALYLLSNMDVRGSRSL